MPGCFRVFLLAVLFAAHCGAVHAEYSTDDLLRMTMESLSYDVEADIASVRGAGKIQNNDSQSLLSARRAAINDARRGLLILKRGLVEGEPMRPHSVSGNVPPFTILSEYVKDGLYFVDIEVSLSELLYEGRRKSHEINEMKERMIRREELP